MEKKKLFTIIFTALLTTLFWCLVQVVADRHVRNKVSQEMAAGTIESLTSATVADVPDNSEPYAETLSSPKASDKASDKASAQPARQSASKANSVSTNLAEDIVGKWTPVEDTRYTIEFTQFGKMTVKNTHRDEYVYKIAGGKIKYDHHIELLDYSTPHRIKIETVDGVTYLSLYDDPDYSGRYKREY